MNNKLFSSFIYSSLSQYLLKAINLASVIAIARLLTPEEVGVYVVAAAVAMIAGEIRNLGASSYIISKKELTESDVRSAIGLVLLVSWGAAFLLVSTSYAVESWYQIKDLGALLIILSLCLLPSPYVGVSVALMNRGFKFGKLGVMSLTSRSIELVAVIAFIFEGYSYFSIAYGAVVASLVEVLIVTLFRVRGTPILPSFAGVADIFRFGVFITGSNLLRRATLSMPDLIIGKTGAVTDVALYSRAAGFLDFLSTAIVSGVSPVTLPYMSDRARQGLPLQEAYLKVSVIVGAFVWPALLLAGFASYPIIMIFFGDQWVGAAAIVPVLSVWSGLRVVHVFIPSVLVANGAIRQLLLYEAVAFLVFFSGLLLGASHGLMVIAFCLSGAAIVVVGIATFVLCKWHDFVFLDFIKAWMQNVLLTAFCGLILFLLSMYIELDVFGHVATVLLMGLATAIAWGCYVYMTKHLVWGLLLELLSKKSRNSL